MKMNTKDTDSLFKKIFGNYLFISQKLNFRCQLGLTKAFPFQYIHHFSKTLMRFWHSVPPRAPILCDMFTSGKWGFAAQI